MELLANDDSTETGLETKLLNTCIDLLWKILQITSPTKALDSRSEGGNSPNTLTQRVWQQKRDLFATFYFWGQGFTRQSRLDAILDLSTPLKSQVISLLVDTGRTILALHKHAVSRPENPDFSHQHATKGGKRRAELASLITRCTALLGDDLKAVNDEEKPDVAEKAEVELINELQIFVQCLVDLTPCLEYPAPDVPIIEQDRPVPELSSNIRSLAQPWCRRIFDLFPAIDATLGERLGVLNWNRFNMLRGEGPASADLDNELDDFKGHQTAPSTTLADTSIDQPVSTDVGTNLDTEITAPDSVESGSDNGFESNLRQGGRPQDFDLETVFTSSTRMIGTFRVPDMPPANEDGNRTCSICTKDLRQSVQTRTDWKRHVYHDLAPYTCTTTSCLIGGVDTFRNRREWVEHEFQHHLAERVWLCSACSARISTKDAFLQHLERNHPEYTWVQEQVAVEASETVGLRMKSPVTCPLCKVNLEPSLDVYAKHVGGHLEQIALIVLQTRVVGETTEGGGIDSGTGSSNGDTNEILAVEYGEKSSEHAQSLLGEESASLPTQPRRREPVPTVTSTRNFDHVSDAGKQPNSKTTKPNQRRIAVIGSRGVGKSALLVRFVDGYYAESYYPTIENTYSKEMRLRGQDYYVEIVDTAGQDEYSILNSKHFIGIHGYMVVYSVRSRPSFEMVQVICEKILNHLGAEWVPIILVGNYSESRPELRQISPEEGRELSQKFNCAWIEVSAKYNENVGKAFELLLSEVEKSQASHAPTSDRCSVM